MKRTTAFIALIFIFNFYSSCRSDRGLVKGTVAGTEVTVESLRSMQEFKVPGPGSRTVFASKGKELAVIEAKSSKEIGPQDHDLKAKAEDDKGQTYDSIYHQAFVFKDKHVEITILFEVPELTVLKTLILDETSFNLKKLRNKNR